MESKRIIPSLTISCSIKYTQSIRNKCNLRLCVIQYVFIVIDSAKCKRTDDLPFASLLLYSTPILIIGVQGGGGTQVSLYSGHPGIFPMFKYTAISL